MRVNADLSVCEAPGTQGEEPAGLEPLFRSRWTWLLLFAFFFGTFCALHGGRITPDSSTPDRYYLLTGDEPHYLLVAHSLAFDGDMDLRNNLAQNDYLAFYDRPVSGYVKNKDWILARVGPRSSLNEEPPRYWAGRALPTQPIGTSALIAPAYRLGFFWGKRIRFTVALFFHAWLAALALVMIELCWAFTGRRMTSVLLPTAVTLSAPLLFYSVPTYPDLPAALLIALGILLLFRMQTEGGKASLVRALALGICAAALPWVHLRFWPSALLLTAGALWPRPGRRTFSLAAVAFSMPWIVSLAGLVYYYEMLFGLPWPVSISPPCSLRIAFTSGWPGLLIDRNHGLLGYLPLALFAAPGLILLFRECGRAGTVAALLLMGYMGLVGTNEGWHGGFAPPLRYWVPAMPLVALSAAVAVARTSARGARMAALVLGAVGPPVAIWAMLHPKLLYSYHHTFLSNGPWAHLWERLPVFFPETQKGSLIAAGAGAVVVALFTLWVLRGRAKTP